MYKSCISLYVDMSTVSYRCYHLCRLEDMVAQRFKQEEYQSNLLRLARKACARVTGLHHFWDGNYSSFSSVSSSLSSSSSSYWYLVYNTSRMVRKTAANITKIHGFFSRKYVNKWFLDNYISHSNDSNSNSSSGGAVEIGV